MKSYTAQPRQLLTFTLALLIAALLLVGSFPDALPTSAVAPRKPEPTWTTYDRPAQYAVVEETNLKITMRDGITLYADAYRPDAPGTFPVLVSQTPYNKGLQSGNSFLVQRGYVHVIVDVRGTANSEGTWRSFSETEQRDGYEIVEWAAQQPWSDGNIGLVGASYGGINQLLTAAQQPPHLKAIFPVVPQADGYRDLGRVGGQANFGFIPGWLILTLALGNIPPDYTAEDPYSASLAYLQHSGGLTATQIPGLIDRFAENQYDNNRVSSPIWHIDQVQVPTFIVGGLRDIFARGEPLLYEALKKRKVPAKLIMVDGIHGEAAGGGDLPADGVPGLDHLMLRWFDHYLKGMDSKPEKMPNVTQQLRGDGGYEVQPDWPHPAITPRRLYLRDNNRLSATPPSLLEAEDMVAPVYLGGFCSGSTDRFILTGIPDECAEDNTLTEQTEVVFDTQTFAQDMKFSGPMAANIWVSTTREEAVLSVRVTDVGPDGMSTELSFGLLAASFRAVDPALSRFIGGENIQPWHPFTEDSVLPVTPGEAMLLQIEIISTNAVIKAGHQLRVSVGPANWPSYISPVPQLVGQAGGILSIHHSPDRPSYITLPVLEPTVWPPAW